MTVAAMKVTRYVTFATTKYRISTIAISGFRYQSQDKHECVNNGNVNNVNLNNANVNNKQ